MSDSPNMNLPDNVGKVGDVMGDCHRCGAYRCWGPPSKPPNGSFVCNKCIASWRDLAVHAHSGDQNPAPKPLSPHYTKLAIDPYEYAHRNGLGMLQGNVVKYVTRYKDKNGKEDLEKAMNTLKRLIDMEYPK